MIASALLALALAPAPQDHIGRIYSYLRSNRDGTEAERVYVYRAARDRIEVAKMRDRCTNAAFVAGELDLARGQATRLIAGRLRPNAAHEDFGELTWDPVARRLDAVVTLPPGQFRESVAVPDQPWHLYDYDLARSADRPSGHGAARSGSTRRAAMSSRRAGAFPITASVATSGCA